MVFAGKEKAQRLSGFLSGVHALEFGPRGRGWSAQLEWVVMGTLADSGPLDHPCLLRKVGSAWEGWGQLLLDPASGILAFWLLEIP